MKRHFSLAICTLLALLLSSGFTALYVSPANGAETSNEAVPLKGKVLETMESGGYTYLQLETSNGNIWVAIPKSQVEKGQVVEVNPGAMMKDFPSKTLNRTFETITFSSGIKGGSKKTSVPAKETTSPDNANNSFSAALQQESQETGGPHSFSNAPSESMSTGGANSARVASEDIKVEKVNSSNGYNVEELYEKAKELDTKTVQVQGKVVKISKMIMGKNWLHIQDGTGNPGNNSHDLVVTTMAEPTQGSIIILEGVLRKDKDFGFGYKYAVMVEDAIIK